MFTRIKKDWNNYKTGIMAAIAYLIVSTWLLGDACPTMIFFKKPCPGCGLTRAFFYVCTFRWEQAWEMNAMIFPLMLFGLWCGFFRYGLGRKVPFFYAGAGGLCIGAIIYFVYRSLLGLI